MTRIGLLMCGHVHPDAVDIGGDYPELFTSLFEPLGVEVVPYAAAEGQLPDSIDECDAWMTSPSRSSVLDDLPWIDALGEFIVDAVERERAFVGICFGHQLLARVLGGRVERAPTGWGVGVKEYEVLEERWWMTPPAQHLALVASHEDQVVELPRDGVLLASADYCPIAAFEIGERCIALQPHIEFTTEISGRLIGLRRELIGEPTAAMALETLVRVPDRGLVAKWFATFAAGQ